MEEFLGWLGQQLGNVIRLVVELLAGAFAGVDDFFTGLGTSLGMSVSVVNLTLLVLGLLLLYAGFRRVVRGHWLGGVLRLGLAVLLLGWLIN